MSVPSRIIIDGPFGRPTLSSRNNGKARWIRGSTSPLDQKGATGWLADLYGGVQSSWDDWARVNIPVNEKFLTELESAMWSYYMTEAEELCDRVALISHGKIKAVGPVEELLEQAGKHSLNEAFFHYLDDTEEVEE